jgi:hypothetical protein
MLTEKSTPAKAELDAVVCFELTVTSVSRPITAEGRTKNTLPFPLLVLIATSVLPMHEADAVPEHIPVFEQTLFTVSQVEPVGQLGFSALHATTPWQVWPVGQLLLAEHWAPPEEMGPHCTPPVMLPLLLLSTQPVRPPAFE